MSKSAQGTTRHQVKTNLAKSGLNKAILDQRLVQFRRQLEYKLSTDGGISSRCLRTTPARPVRPVVTCRRITARHRLALCAWTVGTREKRADVVSAMNVLARGHRVQPVEGRKTRQGPEPKRAASAKRNPPK